MKLRHHILISSILMMFFSLGIDGITTRKFGFVILIGYFFINIFRYKNCKMYIYYPLLIIIFMFLHSLIFTTYYGFEYNAYHTIFFNMIIIFTMLSIIFSNETIRVSKNIILKYTIVVLFIHILFFNIFFNWGIDNILQLRFLLIGEFPLNATFNAFLIIPAILFLFSVDKEFKRKKRIMIFLLSLVALFVVIAPLSRQNMTTILIIIMLITFFKSVKSFIFFIFSSSFLVLILFYTNDIFRSIVSIFINRFSKSFNQVEDGSNMRVEQVIESFCIGTEHPFGIGLSNFLHFQNNLSSPTPESAYNQIFAEMGIVFFVIFIFFLFTIYLRIKKLKAKNKQMYVFLISYFIGILFLSNFNEIFTNLPFWLFTFFVFIYSNNYFTTLKKVSK